MALLGEAYATAGNLTGDRHFYATVRSVAPTGGANGDQAYKLVADSGKYALEIYYWTHTTGLVPPGAPTTVEILVYDDAGVLWTTLHAAGTPPAQGSIGKFFGTVDGTVATALRSGAAELYIRAQVGGIGAYNVDSRAAAGHEGILSCPKEIASITHGTANNDTYDNGTPWSRGVAADENVRLNVNGVEPKVTGGSGSHQEARIVIPDAKAGGGGTTYDWFEDHSGNGHTLTQGSDATSAALYPSTKWIEGRDFPDLDNQALRRTDDAFNLTGANDFAATGAIVIDTFPAATFSKPIAQFTTGIQPNSGAWSIFMNTGSLGVTRLHFTRDGIADQEATVDLTGLEGTVITFEITVVSGTLNFYVNGTLGLTASIGTGTSNTGGDLIIGGAGGTSDRRFDGKVLDLRIWDGSVPSHATLDDLLNGASGTDAPLGSELFHFAGRQATRGAAITDFNGVTQQVTTQPFTDDFLVGDSFENSLDTYGARFEIIGDAALLPDSGAIPWTFLVDGGGTGLTIVDDRTATRTAWYNVDPRVSIPDLVSDEAIYNIHELTGLDFSVQNARSEKITRSLSVHLQDSLGATKATSTQAQANRTLDYQTVNGDDADNTTTGKQWSVYAEDTGTYDSASVNAFKVSTYKALHSAATLPTPGDPTSADSAVNVSRPGEPTETILNYGDDIDISYYVYGVRGQLLADINSPDARSKTVNNADTVEDDVAVQISGGLVSYTYSPALSGSGHTATNDLVGDQKHIRFNYDDGTEINSSDAFGLSSLIPLDDSEVGDGIWTGPNNTDADSNGRPDLAENSQAFIGAQNMFAKAKIRSASGSERGGVTVTMDMLEGATLEQGPFNTAVTRSTTVIGWQDIFYKFTPQAPPGERTLRVSATHGDNFLSQTSVTVTFVPSYVANLYFLMDYERDGTSLHVSLQPIVWHSDTNANQLLSEVTPAAEVTVAPKGLITRFGGAGAAIVHFKAQETFSQVTGGSDDNWHHTFDITGHTNDKHELAVVMSIDGAQVAGRLPLNLATEKAVSISGTELVETLVVAA